MTKGSDLLVAALENEGVEYIFAIPGEENLDVLESLRRSKIKLVLARHEQAAGFMAATYGRLTGRASVCLTTLGPGALNLTTAAAYAHLGAMPMVMITGQKAIRSSRQARFQIVDIVATMRPLTKMATQIVSAQSIPTLVRDAFRVAQQERPGPVHLELPEDIAADEAAADIIPQQVVELPVAPAAAIERAATMIMGASRPLVMLGAAASRPQLAEPLSAFVRRCKIPFFNTQMGKGTVSGASDLYMGTAALSEKDYVHDAVDRADVILCIGHDTVEKPPFIMGPKGPQVIHVSYTPANVERVYFPQCEVVGDVGPSLELLADRVEGRLHNAGALLSLRESILSRISDRATEDRKLLLYDSEPLTADLEITGTPVLTLVLASTTSDGAVHAYLEDIAPEGRVTYVDEGILRVINRKEVDPKTLPYPPQGPAHSYLRRDAEPLTPGIPATIRLSFYTTSVMLRRGHRLRVALAGADSLQFRRYPATGTPTWTVYREAEHASFVELPVRDARP